MNYLKKALIGFCILTLTAVSLNAAIPKAIDIMKAIEEKRSMRPDVTATVTSVRKHPEEGTDIRQFTLYRRDGNDAFALIVKQPELNKGNGYLRVGDNMWHYKANTRTFQHLNQDDTIEGTDMKAGDFKRPTFTEAYEPVSEVEEDMLGDIPVYKFKIRAYPEVEVTYPIRVYYVSRDKNYLTYKRESYSASGTLLRISYTLQYTEVGGQYFPIKSLFLDKFENSKTTRTITGISTSTIPDHVFTKAFLEENSK